MESITIDPARARVSEHNERKEPTIDDEFVESISESGVVQPPTVREIDDENDVLKYEVVIGQRRFLAARKAGLDEIPAILVDWGDLEAKSKSITENVDEFSQDVPTGDRARALKEVWDELSDDDDPDRPSASALADHLGIQRQKINRWIEPLREEWKGGALDPEADTRDISTDDAGEDDSEDESGDDDAKETSTDEQDVGGSGDDQDVTDDESSKGDDKVEEDDSTEPETDAEQAAEIRESLAEELKNMSTMKQAAARRMTGGGEEGQELLRKIYEHDLTTQDVRDLENAAKHGADPFEEIEEKYAGDDDEADGDEGTEEEDLEMVEEAKSSQKTQIRLTLTGDAAEGLGRLADEKQTAESEVAKEALVEWLDDNGYI